MAVATTATIFFPDQGVTAPVDGSWVGDGKFRVESASLNFVLDFDLISYKDVVELVSFDGRLVFQRIIEKARWHIWKFMLSREVLQSEGLGKFLAAMRERGAHIEQLFTGILLVCLAPDDTFNPQPDFMAMVASGGVG